MGSAGGVFSRGIKSLKPPTSLKEIKQKHFSKDALDPGNVFGKNKTGKKKKPKPVVPVTPEPPRLTGLSINTEDTETPLGTLTPK